MAEIIQDIQHKVLAAVDGSIHSFNALRYLSYLFTDLENINVHLLCVVPAGSARLGMEWVDERDQMTMVSTQVRAKLSAARRFMEEAVLQLGRRGIAPAQVTTSVKLSRSSVAADILTEANKGLYDALLIGRRGIGRIEELFMGSSLSGSMAERCYKIPLWIVDGKVNSRRFLLPVDSSFNSLKAADHLGFMLAHNPYAEVSLLHLSSMVGGNTAADLESLSKMWGHDWCERHLNHPDAIYHAPEQMLIDRGLNPERIYRLDRAVCLQPHTHIIRQSSKSNCGTIVIGRRPKGEKKGIFKGVSDSVLDMAKHMAIWVIG
ncbi:hypothetical protein MNBD_DELTA03-24 [hydrothermal vent metagenome]|uniref:UspA domain-containing protein n=1 Tax=hydrothermal vent metagenome TaxID=652676 RepID=A0A3B0VD90_9ZZZZ